MSGYCAPVLAQFAGRPRPGSSFSFPSVDPATGLLQETGATRPLIEELLAAGDAWRRANGIQTVLTESTDPKDPDLIRADSWLFRVDAESPITRGQIDPADPDLVRGDRPLSGFLAAVETTLTKFDRPDPYDPDHTRFGRYIDFVDAVGTDIPKREPDPDVIRQNGGREVFVETERASAAV